MSLTRSLNIPQFDCSWTDQMQDWLSIARGNDKFPSGRDFAEWLIENTEAICESWGDWFKAYAPRSVLRTAMESAVPYDLEVYLTEMEDCITRWVECKERSH